MPKSRTRIPAKGRGASPNDGSGSGRAVARAARGDTRDGRQRGRRRPHAGARAVDCDEAVDQARRRPWPDLDVGEGVTARKVRVRQHFARVQDRCDREAACDAVVDGRVARLVGEERGEDVAELRETRDADGGLVPVVARDGIGVAEPVDERGPLAVGQRRHHAQEAVRAPVDRIEGAAAVARLVVAERGEHGQRPVGQVGHRLRGRHVDPLPPPAPEALVPRREHGDSGGETRCVGRHGTRRRERGPVSGPEPVHHPARSGVDEIRARPVRVRAVGAEVADRTDDEVRVRERDAARAERLVDRSEATRSRGLDQRVRRGNQGAELGAAGPGLQIEHDSALVGGAVREPEARTVSVGARRERRAPARRRPAQRLDPHDVGTEVRQDPAAQLSEPVAAVRREVDGPEPVERQTGAHRGPTAAIGDMVEGGIGFTPTSRRRGRASGRS
jgi:hypothetical protein